MENEPLTTAYAPAERRTHDEMLVQRNHILRFPFIQKIMDVSPDFMMILNRERQIICSSRSFCQFLGLSSMECLMGKRLGEALFCTHAQENLAGCGTTKFCEVCGSVNAVMESQKGVEVSKEWQIMLRNGDALELDVWAAPFEIEGVYYTFFSLRDKSNEKRRRSLERIFFHDVMNTIGGLYGYADLLAEAVPGEDGAGALAKNIVAMTESVIEDVQSQKDLAAAEHNELVVMAEEVDSMALVSEVAEWYRAHEVARGKEIRVSADSVSLRLMTGRALLKRVIGNMTKNALEASKRGEVVTLGSYDMMDEVLFKVHNSSVIPRDVQLQVFKRSFTTKGAGRGLGTYSIKLISERYLKGEVSFTSTPQDGTTFMVSIPKVPPVE